MPVPVLAMDCVSGLGARTIDRRWVATYRRSAACVPMPTPLTLHRCRPHALMCCRAGALEAAAAQHVCVGGLQHPGRCHRGAHHPPRPGVSQREPAALPRRAQLYWRRHAVGLRPCAPARAGPGLYSVAAPAVAPTSRNHRAVLRRKNMKACWSRFGFCPLMYWLARAAFVAPAGRLALPFSLHPKTIHPCRSLASLEPTLSPNHLPLFSASPSPFLPPVFGRLAALGSTPRLMTPSAICLSRCPMTHACFPPLCPRLPSRVAPPCFFHACRWFDTHHMSTKECSLVLVPACGCKGGWRCKGCGCARCSEATGRTACCGGRRAAHLRSSCPLVQLSSRRSLRYRG